MAGEEGEEAPQPRELGDQVGAELRPSHVRARQSANASMSQSLRSSAAIAFTSLQRAAFSSEERV